MGFLLTLDTQRLYWIIYMSATTATFVFFSRHFVFFFGSDSSSLLYFQMYPEGPLRNSPNLPYPASYEEVHFYLLFTYIHLFPRFENFGRIMAVRLTPYGSSPDPPCLWPSLPSPKSWNSNSVFFLSRCRGMEHGITENRFRDHIIPMAIRLAAVILEMDWEARYIVWYLFFSDHSYVFVCTTIKTKSCFIG